MDKIQLKYVNKIKGAMVPTFAAYAVVQFLESNFHDLVDLKYTASLEDYLDQISNDNPTSTIFYLKTKGKNRGYIEQQILEHKGGIESKLIEWKPVEKKQ